LNRRCPLVALLLLWHGGGTAFAQVDWEPFAEIAAGPIFDKVSLTLESGARTESAGPFFYRQETAAATQWGVPPFYAQISQPDVDAFNCEALPPLFSYHRFGRESTTLITPLINIYGGRYQSGAEYRRAMVFPFYYRQTGTDASRNYFALFPFYGTIKNKFLRNEIHFTLFPIYIQSRKRDVVTDNFLYPLIHTRTGNGMSGWQFWPLLGLENKVPTTRTNLLGNVEVIGGYEKLFLVWPFFFEETTGIGTERQSYYQALWPFYTQMSSPQRTSTGIIFPFFTTTDEREKKYREYDFPWPFFVIARGEGKTITRFFPLYDASHNESLRSRTYLWPVYMNRSYEAGGALGRANTRWLVYGLVRVDEKNLQTGETRRRLDSLPLFTYRRAWDGRERLQVLAILEPLLPDNGAVQRIFSPLWSLWVSERNPTNQTSSQALLWNLYRHDSAPELKRTSLFFGLFQHRRTPQQDVLRIFFIPIKSKRPPADQPAAPTTIKLGVMPTSVNEVVEPEATPHPASGHPFPIRWGEGRGEGRPAFYQPPTTLGIRSQELGVSLSPALRLRN
jgi:hypothetical protein